MVVEKKSKRYSNAWAISDRSGMRFPMREMIREPGTNFFIHKSESDGRYNLVDHPQAHITKYARFGDPFAVEDAHPDRSWIIDTLLTDEDNNVIMDDGEISIDIY